MASTIAVDEIQNINNSTLKIPVLNSTSGTGGSILGPNAIIQVVYSGEMEATFTFDASNGSYTQATELNVTITPKFSNSLIWFQGWAKTSMNNSSNNLGQDYQIRRYVEKDHSINSTIAGASWQNYWNRSDFSDDYYPPWTCSRFDLPNTTHQITYQVWGRRYAGNSSYPGWTIGDTNLNYGSDGESSRGHTIVMEIAQ